MLILIWNIHYRQATQKAVQKFNMQKYLSEIYRMVHNWWYKKDYWTWKNKWKIWIIIFRMTVCFWKKTSLKICQVRFIWLFHYLFDYLIELFVQQYIIEQIIILPFNLLFRPISIQKVISSWKLKVSFKASRWYSVQRKISCYNVYLLFSSLGFLQYERKLRQPFYVYH